MEKFFVIKEKSVVGLAPDVEKQKLTKFISLG
jgi:hypothetical protein